MRVFTDRYPTTPSPRAKSALVRRGRHHAPSFGDQRKPSSGSTSVFSSEAFPLTGRSAKDVVRSGQWARPSVPIDSYAALSVDLIRALSR